MMEGVARPLLTVCLITYNQKKYIRQSIDSILNQKVNFKWQIIIADDYSTDGTREVLEEYKKKHPDLITLILQKKNKGPEANWLDLINYPSSKYMLYAEGDDFFTDKNKLQLQLDFLRSHPEYAICYHPVRVFYENHEAKDYSAPSKEERGSGDLSQLIKGNFFYTNSVMFLRQDYTKLPRGIVPMDWYMHIYNAQFGKIGYIDKVMSVYRRHPGSVWWDSAKDVDKIWANYGLAHMEMFIEMLKLYGNNKKYQNIIFNHLDDGYRRLVSADSKYGSTQLNSVVRKYPDITIGYIERLNVNSDRTRNEIQSIKRKLHESKSQYNQSAAELESIKKSRLWKLREVMYKVVPKI